MTPESRLLTARELAQILAVPVATVWKWGRAGQVPCIRLPGGRHGVRFDLADVERVLHQAEGGNGES
jgi:excisionase family DNA binding protein